jgi:hypothetical protein
MIGLYTTEKPLSLKTKGFLFFESKLIQKKKKKKKKDFSKRNESFQSSV